jgi:hypothetical protein
MLASGELVIRAWRRQEGGQHVGCCVCEREYEEGTRCLHCRFEARIASLKREINRRGMFSHCDLVSVEGA